MTCEECKFYQRLFDTLGECRYSPPVVIMNDNKELVSEWPEVHPQDWCGKFVKRRNYDVRAD